MVGTLDRDVIEIESKISKDVFERKMTLDNIKGKYAYTKIKLLKRYKSYSYVEIEIETGRTHQIRLHTASIGHPIAGDIKYNNQNYREHNKKINLQRLFLHSFYLSFFYDEQYEFILDLPIELKEVLSILETYND